VPGDFNRLKFLEAGIQTGNLPETYLSDAFANGIANGTVLSADRFSHLLDLQTRRANRSASGNWRRFAQSDVINRLEIDSAFRTASVSLPNGIVNSKQRTARYHYDIARTRDKYP